MKDQQVSQGSPTCLFSAHVAGSLLPGIRSYSFIPQTHIKHLPQACALPDTKEQE